MSDLPIQIVLAIGSNMGDRLASLRAAVKGLAPDIVVTEVSPVYETAAAYVTDQPAFLNAVLLGQTRLEPLPLLRLVKDMEGDIGRQPTFRYGPRVIDIDVIFHGKTILKTAELVIPHARLAERDFVLRPLNDIAPHLQHPETHRTMSEMLAALPLSEMSCLGKVI